MPALHAPVVSMSVPSMSIVARSKKDRGCLAQTFRRTSSMASCNLAMAAWLKRRQKSPAVVGSGMRWAPRASRKASSLRRRSMSSRQVPWHRAL